MNGEDKKISGISLLENFEFLKDGLQCRKAYKIGSGRFIPFDSIIVKEQDLTGLKVIQPFNNLNTPLGKMGKKSVSKNSLTLFGCPEDGCVKSFPSFEEQQSHVQIGCHLFIEEQNTPYDRIRKQWASKVTSIGNVGYCPISQSADYRMHDGDKKLASSQGWALKMTRKPSRMTEKVKDYLTEKFNKGVQTGQKADPGLIEQDMVNSQDRKGNFVFEPEEWKPQNKLPVFSPFYRESKSKLSFQ